MTVYVLKGGTKSLRLTPNGKEYHVGDEVPLTAAQYRALTRPGILRFAESDAPKAADKKQDKPA